MHVATRNVEGKSALVVEDADGIRSLIRSVLERVHIRVEEARNGAEAIGLFRARHFDVVVVDLMLPGVSGYRVIETLKVERPDVPCVVVTAAGEVGIGVLDPSIKVVRKPFDPFVLQRVVREVISGVDD